MVIGTREEALASKLEEGTWSGGSLGRENGV
jgi:hypothetical protein